MKKINQTEVARRADITDAFFSEILAGKKNPSWKTAKKLAKVLSWTSPVFWMESTSQERREAFLNKKAHQKHDQR